MSPPRTDRWLRLDGTANTRDLGGLPTTDGGTTAPGRILRSDNLQTLSDGDVRRLVGELRLRQVVDLRTTAEILLEGRGPLRAVPEVEHRHFTLLPEKGHHTDVFAVEDDDPLDDLPGDWVETLLPRQATDADESEPPAVRAYLGYLQHRGGGRRRRASRARRGRGGGLRGALRGREGPDGRGGRARPGRGRGPHDAIVADYALTAEVIDDVVARLSASPTYAEDMASRDVASHTPRAATMARVLEVVDERYGGPPGWLEAHGFGAEDQRRLRARLRG